ncbi:hypothetical protein Ciccas_002517 [Cichlidogyrus casuarinus]|uniref:Dihydrolipoamide acetyltransferase component of pyruvate dehydrogenase complex n=1 Tax=Cichlidogyrus casuarinus TaxID=1844966 RepID=A0ABD2QI07_9PLAT
MLHFSARRDEIKKFLLSDIGEGIREVIVKDWFVKVGDKVAQFDEICEVQSDKATVTITSRYDGIIKAIHYKIDETVLVGNVLVDIEVEETGSTIATPSTTSATEPKLSPKPQTTTESRQMGKFLTTPSVRRLAAENNLDLNQITATGKDGRILKEDLLNFLSKGPSQAVPVYSENNEDRIVAITGIKKVMFKTMTESLKVPQFSYCDEIDLTRLFHWRKSLNEKQNSNISFMPFMIKAASIGLKEFPVLNAHMNSNDESITYKANHNIGVAMDTKEGLLVPNVKSVQNLSITAIAKELDRLKSSGKSGKLSPSDLSGGTFTLSNIGSIGGTYTKPIILLPEVAIGGVGKIQRLPRFQDDDSVYPAYILTVSWVADHRVIDGATLASFSNRWKQLLEDPFSLVIDLV